MIDHPLSQVTSPLTDLLNGGGTAFGFFSVFSRPEIVELFAVCGSDFVVLDMEAAATSKTDVRDGLLALNGSACAGIVRVPWLETHFIEHALDAGAHGVLIPKVESATQTAHAVAATFFPPVGRRGLNPVRASGYFTNLPDYLTNANARTLLFVQIESAEAVAQVDEIAATPGLSGLFIGAGDLAASFGHPGDPTGNDMDQAITKVKQACDANGLIPGIFGYSLDLARNYTHSGYRFIAIGNEAKLLSQVSTQALEAVRRT